MTENDIKEQISLAFIDAIRAYNGYNISDIRKDNGIDFKVNKVIFLNINGKKQVHDTDKCIDIQLKSTTEESITRVGDSKILYRLRVKNYNDLIYSRDNCFYTPRILILFILPEIREDWVSISPDELLIKRNAYWFYPNKNLNYSSNPNKDSSIEISIPQRNIFSINTFDKLFKKFFK